ncbi:hypothetical protein Tco_1038782, partial [Tanacetum coccineum]
LEENRKTRGPSLENGTAGRDRPFIEETSLQFASAKGNLQLPTIVVQPKTSFLLPPNAISLFQHM